MLRSAHHISVTVTSTSNKCFGALLHFRACSASSSPRSCLLKSSEAMDVGKGEHGSKLLKHQASWIPDAKWGCRVQHVGFLSWEAHGYQFEPQNYTSSLHGRPHKEKPTRSLQGLMLLGPPNSVDALRPSPRKCVELISKQFFGTVNKLCG